MKDRYVYPAIFYYDNDGIAIEFPDLPGCMPCAETTEQAVINAKEALGLHLYGMEKDGDEIPKASDIRKITIEENGILMLVDVFMPPIRDRINNRFIKKTLSIPYWLNVEAESKGVNFSGVLQEALKEYLQISK
ncbi:MAG: type II toxin-antitoxin system HicB family antitoxin [Oscillospiraceae bacterium]